MTSLWYESYLLITPILANLSRWNLNSNQQAPDATSFFSRWWDAYRSSLAWKTFSEKSGRCGIGIRLRSGRFTYDWSWWYPSGNRPLQQYSASLPGAGYGQFEHIDSLIAKFKEAVWNGQRDWCMSRVTAIISPLWLSHHHHRQAVNHYRDNAITYKAQRDKNARELKLANAAITDMQMRHADVAAADAKYTKELADAKAENDALRDDVAAGRRRLHIKAVCQSACEPPRLWRG